jgi:hypothetical protein
VKCGRLELPMKSARETSVVSAAEPTYDPRVPARTTRLSGLDLTFLAPGQPEDVQRLADELGGEADTEHFTSQLVSLSDEIPFVLNLHVGWEVDDERLFYWLHLTRRSSAPHDEALVQRAKAGQTLERAFRHVESQADEIGLVLTRAELRLRHWTRTNTALAPPLVVGSATMELSGAEFRATSRNLPEQTNLRRFKWTERPRHVIEAQLDYVSDVTLDWNPAGTWKREKQRCRRMLRDLL